MKTKAKKQRLLEAILMIEDMAAHAECVPDELNTEKERELAKCLKAIYRLSHVSRLPRCMKVHDNWEKEFQEMKERILK